MKKHTRLILLMLIICSYITAGYSQDSSLKIVIIRHGEKPDDGNNLNCQGLNRSMQLPKVLNAKFGIPSAVFVPAISTGKKTNNSRMFQTITPYAVKYNLVINTKYDEDDYKHIANDLESRTGTIILVWEHSAIPHLAKALGIKHSSDWPDDDFDSIWIITYKNGVAVLTKDKEGLKPSANCPF